MQKAVRSVWWLYSFYTQHKETLKVLYNIEDTSPLMRLMRILEFPIFWCRKLGANATWKDVNQLFFGSILQRFSVSVKWIRWIIAFQFSWAFCSMSTFIVRGMFRRIQFTFTLPIMIATITKIWAWFILQIDHTQAVGSIYKHWLNNKRHFEPAINYMRKQKYKKYTSRPILWFQMLLIVADLLVLLPYRISFVCLFFFNWLDCIQRAFNL